jgi:hydroxyethylthiazole kinase-like uncharacterized protein yjeF
MKLVTSELMRQIDRTTIDKHGILGPELMENAGRGIAEFMLCAMTPSDRVAVFCGKGNNGGDGFVIARYLRQADHEVTLYYPGIPEDLSPDARLNFDRALEHGISAVALSDAAALPDKIEAEYIVDAVFGTGFTGTPRGITAELIEYINRQKCAVVSVDLPSGLNADTGQHDGVVVRADYTCSLALPKFGLYVSPGRELAGQTAVIPIGIPDSVIAACDLPVELMTRDSAAKMLKPRRPDGHKGDFGKLYVLAGSAGMTGAAVLAAEAAYRSGCGLVKVACPKSVQPILATMFREATSHSLPDVGKSGSLALRGLGEIMQALERHDACVIGPGLGQHRETTELVRRLVKRLDLPTIIDADGLNALAGHPEVIRQSNAPLVLTPHPGEFQRLTGSEVPLDIHKRIKAASEFAVEHECTLVLKGSPTLIADEGGRVMLNPTGNEGMATGGSGDVLSGMIGAFLSQGMEPFDAATCGVFLHGLAGDLAAAELTSRVMIAGDMLQFFPDAFEMI